MRAPAISSWAEKIFFVDWVERMRRRSARREPATSGPRRRGGALRRRGALRRPAPLGAATLTVGALTVGALTVGALTGGALVVLVGQRAAVRRRELTVEALDGTLEAAD